MNGLANSSCIDLIRDGYAVIKAIPDERAAEYVEEIHEWLESL